MSPLLEREPEAEVIAEAVAATAGGRGRFLVIHGEAGIGKTRLLRLVRDRATESGLATLSARGSELERQYAFGIVRQLFEPMLATATEAGRARLFAGAACGAGRVFATGDDQPVAAELAALHGLFWLTANVSGRPTAVLIDDLHWSDVASLRYLAYLLPRMEQLRLLVVAVVRAGEAPTDELLLQGLVSDPTATVLRPRPLSEPAARVLLASILGRDVDPGFARSCVDATAGNPLLLRALADTFARDGVAPTAANRDRITELGLPAVADLVCLRLARLSPTTRSVARAASVLGRGARLAAIAPLAGTDVLTASDSAEELARLGLLEIEVAPGHPDRMVAFAHPLIGAAVYDEMSLRDRAMAHARAADVLARAGAEPEQLAVHVLHTPPGQETRAVPWLRRAAAVAVSRGSPEAALAFLRRCLDEDLNPDQRLAALEEAAAIAVQVDLGEAVPLLEEAKGFAMQPADGARVAARLGVAYGYLRDPDRAVSAFYEALRLLPEDDAEQRRRLEATLLVAAFVAPGRRAEVAERIAGLRALPPHDSVGGRMLQAAIAGHEMAVCDPNGAARARAALADGVLVQAVNGEGALVCGWLALLAADDDAGLVSLEDAVRQAHLHGSPRALAPALTFRALARLWRGQLGEAESDAREALRMARSDRLDMDPSFAGAYLADALVERGRLDEAELVVRQVGLSDAATPGPRYAALDAYAKLLNRQGHADTVAVARDAGRRWHEFGYRNPALASWRSEAVLALYARGEVAEARRLADEELDLATRWAAPRALGRALRVLGQVTGGADGLALLGRAVTALDGSPARLERARSFAEWGAALRRSGRRVEARDALARALDLAEVCDATPLVRQITTELRAAGFRPRRNRLLGPEALTPSERRVVEIAARGASNREIAQSLFITTKTVEVHLTSAYRKLGVTRRGDLARQLAAAPTA